MLETAQKFTQEQVQGFMVIVTTLALTHAGSICAAVFQHFRRIRKMRRDISAAHDKIRNLELTIKSLTGDEVPALEGRSTPASQNLVAPNKTQKGRD